MKSILFGLTFLAALAAAPSANAEIYDGKPFYAGVKTGFALMDYDGGPVDPVAVVLQGKVGFHTPCSKRHYLCAIGGYVGPQVAAFGIDDVSAYQASMAAGVELFLRDSSVYFEAGPSVFNVEGTDLARGYMAGVGSDVRIEGPVGMGAEYQHYELITVDTNELVTGHSWSFTFNVIW